MIEYSKVNVKLVNTQLKKTENCHQRENRNNFANEFENA